MYIHPVVEIQLTLEYCLQYYLYVDKTVDVHAHVECHPRIKNDVVDYVLDTRNV